MAWTTPTQRATGFLVTAAVYNTDIIDDLAYLKGQAGAVVIEDSITADIGGVYSHGFKTPSRREVRFTWQGATVAASEPDVQLIRTTANGGTVRQGGTGQIVLKVDNDVNNSQSAIDQQAALASAFSVLWNTASRPYVRVDMATTPSPYEIGVEAFIGFRAATGVAIPAGAAEHFFGFRKRSSLNAWQAACGNASAETEATLATWLTVNNRHILEAWMHDSKIEFWIDGTLRATLTTTLPSSTLILVVGLLDSDGTGTGAVDTQLTLGEAIFQEDTP